MFSRILALSLLCCALDQAAAGERVALVIGNSSYENAPLVNPANDAAEIAAALEMVGFKVTKKLDLTLPQFADAVVAFNRALKKNDVALFFYAGHGLQVKGENFLVPIGARIAEEFQVKDQCYKADQVLAAMEASEASMKIVVLDSCRDNPFTRSWTRGGSNQGLATISDIPEGTIIAFSTAPGKTALDGRRGNSPYTAHLVNALRSRPKEGLEITELFREASRQVKKETGQAPWLNLDASLERYFLWSSGDPEITKPKPEVVSDVDLTDLKLWDTQGGWSQKDGVLTLTPRVRPDVKRSAREDDFLWSKKMYDDFEIEFEYQLQAGGNSGFYFGCEKRTAAFQTAVEVQIRDTVGPLDAANPNYDNGGVYPGLPPTKNAGKAVPAWNQYVITRRKGRLTVVLNGEKVNEADLTQGAFVARSKRGYIGFQDFETVLFLRKIKIREF